MVVALEVSQESVQWAHTVATRNTFGFVTKITLAIGTALVQAVCVDTEFHMDHLLMDNKGFQVHSKPRPGPMLFTHGRLQSGVLRASNCIHRTYVRPVTHQNYDPSSNI